MKSLRFILITKNRHEELDKMHSLIFGDPSDDRYMLFTTSYSYDVRDAWKFLRQKVLTCRKSPAQKIDILFAYTFLVNQHDTWMMDNEGDVMGFVVDQHLGESDEELIEDMDMDDAEEIVDFANQGLGQGFGVRGRGGGNEAEDSADDHSSSGSEDEDGNDLFVILVVVVVVALIPIQSID